MKISVKIKTKAREERIRKTGEGIFSVWVKAPAEKGKANLAVIKVLSRHFKMPQNSIRIISGLTSSQKVVIIDD